MNAAVRHAAARLAGLSLATLLGLPAAVQAGETVTAADPTEFSIEQLLEVKVYSASKFEQNSTEAPGGVTIVNAADIKAYGYRTLADVLRGVRGFYVTYDRNYTYIGVRGFSRMGDYNARVLLLVDGYRINDPVYDSAFSGTEFPLDVDLIERIEIVRGAGSSIYGSNAFFAVINVITRHGADLNGVESAASIQSFGTDGERISDGGRTGNGFEWMASASRYRSRGQDQYYPEFDTPATNNGIAHDLDGDHYEQAYSKFSYGGATLAGGFSHRVKHIPTASYGTDFNDPRAQTADQEIYADLSWYHALTPVWEFSPRLFYGRYTYTGDYPEAGIVNRDEGLGEWWGAEAKTIGHFEQHKLLLGAEYQDNIGQDQANFDLAPRAVYLDDHRNSRRDGFYVQDEFTIAPGLLFNGGLRYDYYSTAGSAVNPRMALVWSPLPPTAIKLLYGTAFRAPNTYELYYAAVPNKANPQLRSEKIRTWEMIVEHELQPNFRLTADAYYNQISNLINQVVDPADGMLVFQNSGHVEGRGVELEAERAWTSQTRLRASLAWQSTRDRDTGGHLNNSPAWLGKLSFATPLHFIPLRAGAEAQYNGNRSTLSGATLGGYVVTNVSLLTDTLLPGIEVSGSVYNLLDRSYADPARPEHAQNTIPQDGRSFRFKLVYHLPHHP